jgi:hypothetical protein
MQQQHRQGSSEVLDAEICPVRRQMEAILGGVDDTVSAGAVMRNCKPSSGCPCQAQT